MTAVVHLVLVYHREAGRLLVKESYSDGDAAIRRQFELEAMPEYRDMEIVTLSADSEQTLHQTHGRYFYTLEELVQQFKNAVQAA